MGVELQEAGIPASACGGRVVQQQQLLQPASDGSSSKLSEWAGVQAQQLQSWQQQQPTSMERAGLQNPGVIPGEREGLHVLQTPEAALLKRHLLSPANLRLQMSTKMPAGGTRTNVATLIRRARLRNSPQG